MASALAVPATAVVVIGITESSNLLTGKGFTIEPVIGGFVMGVFLYAISEVNGHLAVIFGVLIVLATIIEHGQPLLDRLNGKTQPVKKKKAGKHG